VFGPARVNTRSSIGDTITDLDGTVLAPDPNGDDSEPPLWSAAANRGHGANSGPPGPVGMRLHSADAAPAYP
jgi:hypothetical protein